MKKKNISNQEEILSIYNEKIKDLNSDWYFAIRSCGNLLFTKSMSTLLNIFRFNINKSWYVMYIPKDEIFKLDLEQDSIHHSFGIPFNSKYVYPSRIHFIDKSSLSIRITCDFLINNIFDGLLRKCEYYEFSNNCLIDVNWESLNFITFLFKQNLDDNIKIDFIEYLSNYDGSSLCYLFKDDEPSLKLSSTYNRHGYNELKDSIIKDIENELIKILIY